MSDMLQSTRSPRWQALQRSLAQSFGTNTRHSNINAKQMPAATGGSWLDRVRCSTLQPQPNRGIRA
jgi:hypothetical protein